MEIKNLREKLGLSQSKFAAKFNIPIGTIHNWEQGIRKPPIYVTEMIEKIIILEENLCQQSYHLK